MARGRYTYAQYARGRVRVVRLLYERTTRSSNAKRAMMAVHELGEKLERGGGREAAGGTSHSES